MTLGESQPNLAWLAAALNPRDVAAHPNFADPEYDKTGPAQLGALLMGGEWDAHAQRAADPAAASHDLITMAREAMHTHTLTTGTRQLRRAVLDRRFADLAQNTASTLLACAALSELDDFDTCFELLEASLDSLDGDNSAASRLCQASLLQQAALRGLDAGRDVHRRDNVRALVLLNAVTAEDCPSYAVSRGVAWTSVTTTRRMISNLRGAALSLIPRDSQVADLPIEARPDGPADEALWAHGIKAPVLDLISSVARQQASAYSKVVAGLFAREFGSLTRSLLPTAPPDTFTSLLALELHGHGQVYEERRDLALLRLVQAGDSGDSTADSLRLLRQAGAKKDLDLALNRLREGGPLVALSGDARQILRTRTSAELLRTVELRVLRTASELLAQPEARLALDATKACLKVGGPANLPLEWELDVSRLEVAWSTAAALANACAAQGEVAELLLEAVRTGPVDDQLFDQAIAKAIRGLDWSGVPQELQAQWLGYLGGLESGLRVTAGVLYSLAQQPEPHPGQLSEMDLLVYQLNAALQAVPADVEHLQGRSPLVLELLREKRAEAAVGAYSFGGLDVADIAAGLILVADADQVWPALSDFLLDEAVQRSDRTGAFERLARVDSQLPPAVSEAFASGASALLASPAGQLGFESQAMPYPAALRFLAAHGLIDHETIYDSIATLAASADSATRQEAAVTLAVLAQQGRAEEDLLGLALPLARDAQVRVRAQAGRTLAVLAGSKQRQLLAKVARRRLSEMLVEDGLLSPLLTLRALSGTSRHIPEELAVVVADLADRHPSRLVRDAAAALLDGTGDQDSE